MEVHYYVHKSTPLDLVPSHMKPVYIITTYYFKTIVQSTSMPPKLHLLFRFPG
jgi:hypothetical protein